MEIGYLQEVKAIIKSLVVSYPHDITIDKLNKDFRDTEGKGIPYQQLGHNNLETFLRSIPDTVRVLGSGITATVEPVTSSKTKHIQDLVATQKKTRPPKSRRSGRQTTHQSNYCRTVPPIRIETSRPPVNSPNIQNNNFLIHGADSNSTKFVYNSKQPKMQNHYAPTISHNTGASQSLSDNQRNTITQFMNTVKSNGPENVQRKVNCAQRIFVPVNNFTRPKDSFGNQKNNMAHVANAIKNNGAVAQLNPTIHHILSSTNNSIGPKDSFNGNCAAGNNYVQESLANHMKKTLRFAETDNDVTSDCNRKSNTREQEEIEMNNRRNARSNNMQEPQEDKHLTDSLQKPTVYEKQENKSKNNWNSFFEIDDICNKSQYNIDEAIPEWAIDHQVHRVDLPRNAVGCGKKIEQYSLPNNFQPGAIMGVFISEIHNPYKFWFHLHKEDNELDMLMNKMECYYKLLDEDQLRIPNACILPGQVCAAIFNGMWHRAEVLTSISRGENKAKVFFMDYGTVSYVELKNIKYLLTHFASLPAQAIRGCLSHVKPRGLHWSHEATNYFFCMVTELMLYAQISEIDKLNRVVYMVLCDTNSDDVVQINKTLVEKRFALYDDKWYKSKTTELGERWHHPREDYPTFEMIERGEYPSLIEILELNLLGINYESIIDRILLHPGKLNEDENAPEAIRKLPFPLLTTNPFRCEIILQMNMSLPTTIKTF